LNCCQQHVEFARIDKCGYCGISVGFRVYC